MFGRPACTDTIFIAGCLLDAGARARDDKIYILVMMGWDARLGLPCADRL
jgi:hypothetical protein